MATRQALFRFDAGLLFVAAGLALCAAAVLLPAQQDLFKLQQQLDELRHQDDLMRTRLRITAEVLRELDRGNPELQRRLIASQLNLAPAHETPIVLVTSRQPDVSEWIAARVRVDPSSAAPHTDRAWPDTALSRLVGGPYRLWILGGSVLCVFIGLMHGTGTTARRRDDECREGASDETSATALRAASDDAADPVISDHPFRTAGDGAMTSIDAAETCAHDERVDAMDGRIDDGCCEIVTCAPEQDEQFIPAAANDAGQRRTTKEQDVPRFPNSLFE